MSRFDVSNTITYNVYNNDEIKEQRQLDFINNSCPYILYYVKKLFTIKNVDRNKQIYITNFYNFINKILVQCNHYNKLKTDIHHNINPFTVFDIRHPPKTQYIDYKSTWGRHYWHFLHTVSILIYKNTQLVDEFAYLMLNFDIILLCNACILNYRRKYPLKTVTYPIIKTRDPITIIFELHNTVTQAIAAVTKQILKILTFKEFQTLYSIEAKETYNIEYRHIIIHDSTIANDSNNGNT